MAISNVSNKEKTIKSMYSSLDSDIYSIDKTLFYCNYSNRNDQAGYVVQFEDILDNYRDYLETKLVDADVPKSMYYQPAAFAEMYYGTPDLDFLVLYFAKMVSLFEFKKSQIKVLPKAELLKINKLFIAYKSAVENSYKNPVDYIKEIE